jgi:urease accessory protein
MDNMTSISSHESLHALLLLSDSALPLGSFAFSSGLESFLGHKKFLATSAIPQAPQSSAIWPIQQAQHFQTFLFSSLQNTAKTALPYVLAAYHHPHLLPQLDNDFDASTPCTVARRASVAQGKALVAVWERALCFSGLSGSKDVKAKAARDLLTAFAADSKSGHASRVSDNFDGPLNAHLAPLFGAVSRATRLTAADTAYVFLLNHAKAVVSAGVRAGVLGPYQAQAILAGSRLREDLSRSFERLLGNDSTTPDSDTLTADEWLQKVQNAAICVPVMDLWMGRHELLYSRIFNS